MIDERTVPCSLEAERAVLGSALLDPAVFDEMADIILADDFFRDAHTVVWSTIASLRAHGQACDVLLLAEELQRQGNYRRVGGDGLISDLVSAVPHAGNAMSYAAVVKEKSRLRRLISALGDGLARATDPPSFETVDEVASHVETLILDATRDLGSAGLCEVADAAGESLERLARREGGEVTGIRTGFDNLDAMTDGMHAGQLWIIAARPGLGKSAMALDVAGFATLESDRSVLFCSLEMGARELTDRILAARAGVPGLAIRDGVGLGAEEHHRMGRVYEALRASRWAIDDASARTVSELASIAWWRRTTHGLDLIVVDYLQLVTAETGRGSNRQEQVASVSRDLKKLAKALDVPVLAMAQLNREVEGRADMKPRLSDLRESGAIEQDADVVLLIHRLDDRRDAQLLVAKNRSGPEGHVELAYEATYPRYRNPDPLPADF